MIKISKKKTKKLTPEQQQYQQFSKEREPERKVLRNCFRAFISGGIICTIGQLIQTILMRYFHFNKDLAGNTTSAIVIIAAVLLTGFGVFDHIAQWAGAGTAIPITGFANSIASTAIEHKTEGYVLGVGGNMFKLAGSVITFGVFSAFVVAIIKITFKWLGGM